MIPGEENRSKKVESHGSRYQHRRSPRRVAQRRRQGGVRFAAIGICQHLHGRFSSTARAAQPHGTVHPAGILRGAHWLAMASALWWSGAPLSRPRRAVVAGIGVVGSAALVVSFAEPSLALLQMPASIVCSCVLGWLYLQWGVSTCALGRARAVGCLFIGNIAASALEAHRPFASLRLCAPSPWRCRGVGFAVPHFAYRCRERAARGGSLRVAQPAGAVEGGSGHCRAQLRDVIFGG